MTRLEELQKQLFELDFEEFLMRNNPKYRV